MHIFVISVILASAEKAFTCLKSNENPDYKSLVYYGNFSKPMDVMKNEQKLCQEIVSLREGLKPFVIIWMLDANDRYLWLHSGGKYEHYSHYQNRGSTTTCPAKATNGNPMQNKSDHIFCSDLKRILKSKHKTEEFHVSEIMLFQPQAPNESEKLDKYPSKLGPCLKRNPEPTEIQVLHSFQCCVLDMTRNIFGKVEQTDCSEAFEKELRSKETTKGPSQLSTSTRKPLDSARATSPSQTTTSASSSTKTSTKTMNQDPEMPKSTANGQNAQEKGRKSPSTKRKLTKTNSRGSKRISSLLHHQSTSWSKSLVTSSGDEDEEVSKSTTDGSKKEADKEGTPRSTQIDSTATTRGSQKTTKAPQDHGKRMPRNSHDGFPRIPHTSPPTTIKPVSPTPKIQNETSNLTNCEQELKTIQKDIDNLKMSLEKKNKATSGWVYFVIGLFTSLIVFTGIFLIWYITCRQSSGAGQADSSTVLSGEQEAVTEMSQSTAGLDYSRAGDNNTTKEGISESQDYANTKITKNIVGKKTKNAKKESIVKPMTTREVSSKTISPTDHTTKTATLKSVGPSIAIH